MKYEVFGCFVVQVFYWIDWILVCLMVVVFVVVGNFEDVIYVWCNFVSCWDDEVVGIILVVGGGVMGVCFGIEKEVVVGIILLVDVVMVDFMLEEIDGLFGDIFLLCILQSIVGLVWCVLLLWMFLLLLLFVVVWMGQVILVF